MDYKIIIEKADRISIKENSLKWWEWERYSTRQAVSMKMGGIIGKIAYKEEDARFLPLLLAGEILYVGKGTSFGLGK
jgi:hypothetical protein